MMVIDEIISSGFYVGTKLTDRYSEDMTSKVNRYELQSMTCDKEVDHLLVISEYWDSNAGLYEINAYIS